MTSDGTLREAVRTVIRRHTSTAFRAAVYRALGLALDAVVAAVFYTIALPAMYVLERIAPLRIGEIRIDHIGHQAIEPELLLRQLQLDGGARAVSVFVVHGPPSNRQLLEMWKRRLHIYSIGSRFLWRVFTSVKPHLARTGFDQPFPGACAGWEGGTHCHDLMLRATPRLSFTPEEEARGQAELRRMGVPEGAWFVAFHARDPAYYEALSDYRRRYAREHRDMPIETMLPAMQWIAASGGYAIRMGAVVEQALPDFGLRVIDYSTRFRTDFMDIYLCARARFMMASNSGLCSVAQIFDVPVGISNVFPFRTVPSGKGALYIRMFVRDRATGEILSFPDVKRRELLKGNTTLAQEFSSQHYEERGLEVVHNDADDILGLCRDMMDYVEGRAPSSRALWLRDRYRLLHDDADRQPGAAQIGARFVVRHAHLIASEPSPALAMSAASAEAPR